MRTVISLYTGLGGVDFGLEAAGFRVAVAVERDPVACRTLKLNRKWPLLEGDIHAISSEAILNQAGLRPGEADVLVAGPPCQPFSKSSYWRNGDARRLEDPRAATLSEFLRVLHDTRPRAFLLENVYGLAYKGKDEALRYLLHYIDAINRDASTNYRIAWKVLNAAGYGVPQLRERVFLVGCNDGQQFEFPTYSHGPPTPEKDPARCLKPYRTAWDALGDLPRDPQDGSLKVGGYWGDLLPSIPEGQNYLWHTKRGGGIPIFGWRTRYWSFLLKLKKTKPSWTIQAQPGSAVGPFHWRNRRLSVQEMCRLQTLPDDLRFACARGDAQRMIGNAVPSLLAEILGQEIRWQLLGDRRRTTNLKFLPPSRRKVPSPEKVRQVLAQYYPHIGDHPDHPGKGKGVGAQRRPLGQRSADVVAVAEESTATGKPATVECEV